MISYLLLALTISLVACNPLQNEKFETETGKNVILHERYLKEKSTELLHKLIQKLKAAYDKGAEAFDKVINDPDITEILNHMDALTRRIAQSIINKFKEIIKKIDEATRENPESLKRDLKGDSKKYFNKLVQILLNSYKQGLDYFNKVVNDPDVQGILDHLGPLSRKIADSIINEYRELLEKIDEATKETPKIEKRLLVESSKELLKRLTQILIKAYRKGGEYFDQVINDPDVKTILEHLGPLSRKVAESIIENFKELIDKIDEATKEKTDIEKRDFKESSFSLLKKLTNILTKAFQSGSKAFNEALEDPDVKEILGSLDGISRRAANYMIEKFKEMIIKLDEITNDQPKSKRNLIESTTNNMKKLIQILIKASKKGSEYFRNILNDPDFIVMQEHLNSIEQRFIYSIIKKFLEIFDKIDNATKVESELTLKKRYFEILNEDAIVELKKLTQILLDAYKNGVEYFDKVVNDSDVQNIIQHLDPLSRIMANSLIENFRELIEKIDNAAEEK